MAVWTLPRKDAEGFVVLAVAVQVRCLLEQLRPAVDVDFGVRRRVAGGQRLSDDAVGIICDDLVVGWGPVRAALDTVSGSIGRPVRR
jgi:hypothetical protein